MSLQGVVVASDGVVKRWDLLVGETVASALQRSLIDLIGLEVSIWGRAVEPSQWAATLITATDRLELTRDMVADPKTVRAHKVDNKPRKGWVARANRFTLSQIKDDMEQRT
jgi:putative ubiquitin-RnfH superfamily antitoxin RatB of RatAB toxin-antitoxin module